MRRACILVGLVFGLVACAGGGAGARGQPSTSGIAGRVVAGPVCPVETVPPRPGCAARPLSVTLRIRATGRHASSVSVRSGSDGRFWARLPPGAYVVQATRPAGSAFPRPPADRRVRVKAGRFTQLRIAYDTGIR